MTRTWTFYQLFGGEAPQLVCIFAHAERTPESAYKNHGFYARIESYVTRGLDELYTVYTYLSPHVGWQERMHVFVVQGAVAVNRVDASHRGGVRSYRNTEKNLKTVCGSRR